MDKVALMARLDIRAQAFVSDPAAVLPEYLSIAADEAIEIAGVLSQAPVLMDIAFYRFLLLHSPDGIGKEELDVYKLALSNISDPVSPNVKVTGKVKLKPNPYL